MANARAMQMYMNPNSVINTQNIYTKFTQRLQHYQTVGEFGSYILPVQEVPNDLINQLLGVVQHDNGGYYSINQDLLNQTRETNIAFDRISLPYVYFDQKENRFMINSGQQLGGDQPMQYNQFTSDMYDIHGRIGGIYLRRQGSQEYEFFNFSNQEQVDQLNQLITDTQNRFEDVNVQVELDMTFRKTGRRLEQPIYTMLGGNAQIEDFYRGILGTINQGAISYQQVDQNIRGVLNRLVTQQHRDEHGNLVETPLNVNDFATVTQQPVSQTEGVPDQLVSLKNTITETLRRSDVSVYSLGKKLSQSDIQAIAKKINQSNNGAQSVMLLDFSNVISETNEQTINNISRIALELSGAKESDVDVTMLKPIEQDIRNRFVVNVQQEEYLEQQDYLHRISQSVEQYEGSQEFNTSVNNTLKESLIGPQVGENRDIQRTLYEISTGQTPIQPAQVAGVQIDPNAVRTTVRNITQQHIKSSMGESTSKFLSQVSNIQGAINMSINGQQYQQIQQHYDPDNPNIAIRERAYRLQLAKEKLEAANKVMSTTHDAQEYARQYFQAEDQYNQYIEGVNQFRQEYGDVFTAINDSAVNRMPSRQQLVTTPIPNNENAFLNNRLSQQFMTQDGHVDRNALLQFMEGISTDQLQLDINQTMSLNVNSLQNVQPDIIRQNVHRHVLEQFGIPLQVRDQTLSVEQVEQLYNQAIPEDVRRWIDTQVEEHMPTLQGTLRDVAIKHGRDLEINHDKRFINIGKVKRKGKRGKVETVDNVISVDEVLQAVYSILGANQQGNNDITLRNLFYGFADRSSKDRSLFDIVTQSTERQDYSVVSQQMSGLLSGLLRIAIRTGRLTGETINTTREQLLPNQIDIRNTGQLFVKQIAVRQGQQLINRQLNNRGQLSNIYESMRFYEIASGGNETQFYRNVYPHELMQKTSKTLNASNASDILMKVLQQQAKKKRRIDKRSRVNDRFNTAIKIYNVSQRQGMQSRLDSQGQQSIEQLVAEGGESAVAKYVKSTRSSINSANIAQTIWNVAAGQNDNVPVEIVSNYQAINFRTLSSMYQNQFRQEYDTHRHDMTDTGIGEAIESNLQFNEALNREYITHKEFIRNFTPENRARQLDIVDRLLEEEQPPNMPLPHTDTQEELEEQAYRQINHVDENGQPLSRYDELMNELLGLWRQGEDYDPVRAREQINKQIQYYRGNSQAYTRLINQFNRFDSHLGNRADPQNANRKIVNALSDQGYVPQRTLQEMKDATINFIYNASPGLSSNNPQAVEQFINLAYGDILNMGQMPNTQQSQDFSQQLHDLYYQQMASKILTPYLNEKPNIAKELAETVVRSGDVSPENIGIYRLFRSDRGLDILSFVGQTYYKTAGQLVATGMSDRRAHNILNALFGVTDQENKFHYPKLDNIVNPMKLLIDRVGAILKQRDIQVTPIQENKYRQPLEQALEEIMGDLYDANHSIQENLNVFIERSNRVVNRIVNTDIVNNSIQRLLYGAETWGDVNRNTPLVDEELGKYVRNLYDMLYSSAGITTNPHDTLYDMLNTQPASVKMAVNASLMELFNIDSISDISPEEDLLEMLKTLNDEQVGKQNVQSDTKVLINTKHSGRFGKSSRRAKNKSNKTVMHLLKITEENTLRAWFTNVVNEEMQAQRTNGASNVSTFVTYNNAKKFMLANTSVQIVGDAKLMFSIRKKKHSKATVSTLKLAISDQNVKEAAPFVLNRVNARLQDQLYGTVAEQIYNDIQQNIQTVTTENGARQAYNNEIEEGMEAIWNQVVGEGQDHVNNYQALEDMIVNRPEQFENQLNVMFYSSLLTKDTSLLSNNKTQDITLHSLALTQVLREQSVYRTQEGIDQYFTNLDLNNTNIDDFMYSRFGINTTFNKSMSDYFRESINDLSGMKPILTTGTQLLDTITEALNPETMQIDHDTFVTQVRSKMSEPNSLYKLQYFLGQQDNNIRQIFNNQNLNPENVPLHGTITAVRAQLTDQMQEQMTTQQNRLYNLGISEGARQLKANLTGSMDIIQKQVQYAQFNNIPNGEGIQSVPVTREIGNLEQTNQPLKDIFGHRHIEVSTDNMDLLTMHMWNLYYSTSGNMEGLHNLQAELQSAPYNTNNSLQQFITRLSNDTQNTVNDIVFQLDQIAGPEVTNRYLQRMQTNPDQFEDTVQEMIAVAKINGAHIKNLNLGSEFNVIIQKAEQYYQRAQRVPELLDRLSQKSMTIDQFNAVVQEVMGKTENDVSENFQDLGRFLDWFQTTTEAPDIVTIANNQVLVREEDESGHKVLKFIAAKENGKGGSVIEIQPNQPGNQDVFMLSMGQLREQDQEEMKSLDYTGERNVIQGDNMANIMRNYEQRVQERVQQGDVSGVRADRPQPVSPGATQHVEREVNEQIAEDVTRDASRAAGESPSWVKQFTDVVGDWFGDVGSAMRAHPRQTAGIQQQAIAVSVVGMAQRQQYKDDINDYKKIIKYNEYKQLPPVIPIKPNQVTLNGMYQQHMYNNYIYRQGGGQ